VPPNFIITVPDTTAECRRQALTRKFVTDEIRTMNASEKRSVELAIEVPGTPEEVWEAIATGPGISVWFVPTEIDGDAITMHHGSGMDQTGAITASERPHRFAFEVDGFKPAESAEPERMALEICVEAKRGGMCVVRLVNSGFGSGPEWDRQIDASRLGWQRCLAVLRLYLTRFAGQQVATRAMARTTTSGDAGAVWSALGVADAAAGEHVTGPPGLAGVIDQVMENSAILRVEEPALGIGVFAVSTPGEDVYATIAASLFGEAPDAERSWQAWLEERLG
jgi:uncharacterized protein YndB with AHSA1/START domain